MPISTVKLSATAGEGFKTEVQASQNFIIDQPKPASNGEGANPLEYFLATLPGCIIAIGRIIANQKKLDVRGFKVDVEGDIDKAVLMGNSDKNRAGFLEIRTKVEIDSDMSDQEKKEYLEEIERRCPIADVMINGTKVKNVIV